MIELDRRDWTLDAMLTFDVKVATATITLCKLRRASAASTDSSPFSASSDPSEQRPLGSQFGPQYSGNKVKFYLL